MSLTPLEKTIRDTLVFMDRDNRADVGYAIVELGSLRLLFGYAGMWSSFYEVDRVIKVLTRIHQ